MATVSISTSSVPEPEAGSSASSSGAGNTNSDSAVSIWSRSPKAREQALANRKLARSGGDPLSDKRRAKAVPTFAEAAAALVEQKQAGWRSPRQAKGWLHSLERYAFPRIGSRPVSEVTSADVLEILSQIWHTKAPTAKSVRQRIRAVLEWAVAMEYRTDNPCDRIGPVLGPQRDVVRHMRALPHRDVAAALEAVRASKATTALKLAFEFPGVDGVAVRRGALGDTGRDRHGRPRVDHRGDAYEGEPRAPGTAQ